MKQTLLTVATILAVAAFIWAGVEVGPTNYLAGYRLIPSSGVPDVGDLPLESNTAYACIRISDVAELTEAQAAHLTTTGDIRRIIYAINAQYYDAGKALAKTNRPVHQTLDEGLKEDTGNTGSVPRVKMTHNLMTKINMDAERSIPAE